VFELASIYIFLKPIIKALLILAIGHFAVVYIVRLIKKAFKRSNMDISLISFLIKAIQVVLYLLIVMAMLSSLGISTGGMLAALSAAGVAVAVALKDSLSNVAGGILLLISPRFATGDYIKTGGDEGTVQKVDLLHTNILTVDNRSVSIPNGVLINNHITNYTHENKRRVDITFSVSYDADTNAAKGIIKDTILNHPLTLKEPDEPLVRVSGYEDNGVNIATKTWCKTNDYWDVYFDLTEQVREALYSNGIEFPYNQIDIHIKEKRN